MDLENIFQQLKAVNARISVEDKRLRIDAAKGAIDEKLKTLLQLHKEDLVNYINRFGKSTFSSILKVIPAPDYPLSSAQRRLWILSQFEESNVAYNLPSIYTFAGDLDMAALKHAFESIISRHESLRTVFRTNDQADVRQIILPVEEIGFEIGYQDIRNTAQPEEQTAALVRQECLKPFDLSAGPLLRACLFRIEAEKWIFMYTVHHIISDGWSMGVLMKELLLFYNAHTEDRSDFHPGTLRIQYKDYSAWQQEQLKGEAFNAHRAYWLEQLSGELPVLELPGYQMRTAMKTYNGRLVSRRLPAKLGSDLKKFCLSEGCTLFMGLFASVNMLLYRYTGQEDILTGSPIAGREHIDLEGQIGFYINTLVLRARFKGTDSYRKLLSRLKQITLDAYAHQAYPFDQLVDELNLKADMSRNALFDVSVALQNTEADIAEELHGLNKLKISEYTEGENLISKFDLTFNFTQTAGGIDLNIEYNSDIYNLSFAEQLAINFEQLLAEAITNPDTSIQRLDYLSAEEKHQLLKGFNDTLNPHSKDKTIVSLFQDQVERTPDHVAVVFADTKLSYREVNNRSNQLANYLKANYSIQADDLIGILLDRSEWMIIAILGILKSGGAFMPVDAGYPEDRVKYMLADSQCKVLLNKTELSRFIEVRDQYDKENLSLIGKPGDMAYVIYTSGSTGKPKGVMIEHGSAAVFFESCGNKFNY